MEGQDLARQIEDAEAYIAELGKTKISLTTQVRVKLNIPPDAKQLSSGYVSVANVEQYFCTNLVLSQIFFLASL